MYFSNEQPNVVCQSQAMPKRVNRRANRVFALAGVVLVPGEDEGHQGLVRVAAEPQAIIACEHA